MKNSSIKFVMKYFKKYKISFIICSILIIICNSFYILTGYLNGAVIENVIGGNVKLSVFLLLLYIVLDYITEVVSRNSYHNLSIAQIKVARELGYDTYKKALDLPAYAFEEQSSGQIINRITNDTETIVGSVDRLISIVSSVITAIIILIYIFFNAWIIGVLLLIFLLGYYFIVKYFSKKLEKEHKARKEVNDKFTALSNETIRGIREVKTLGIKGNLLGRVAGITHELFDSTEKEFRTGRIFDVISCLLKITLEGSAFMLCIFLTYKGIVSVTFFVAMTYYIYRFTWLIEIVNDFSRTYQQLKVALKRIEEILKNELYEDTQFGDVKLDKCTGVIEFKNVVFGYKNEGTLLNNMNIKFESSKKIAIVGASGEGKSTLFNLITRIFDVDKGVITLDGIDIRDLDEDSLRRHISIIRQDPFIFNRSIKENFKLLDEHVKLTDIRKYTQMANIDDYIMSLPKKYDTLIGEGGVNLSGGQKQRLAIARSLQKNSKVILFDEATSALDNESQDAIKKSINELVKDHTVIIIAHRLSTIIDADQIYVIKKGKVFAEGNHETLMKKCKYYQKLYTSEEIKTK
ncbi:MAG: ABC transporter ATP-binding protein [Bacilli bacterium]|nr:ABC transporter ATP-binding protein [Bacilli bacterium]